MNIVNAWQACPCTSEALCKADTAGKFRSDCSWNSNTPGYWYFGHGGNHVQLPGSNTTTPSSLKHAMLPVLYQCWQLQARYVALGVVDKHKHADSKCIARHGIVSLACMDMHNTIKLPCCHSLMAFHVLGFVASRCECTTRYNMTKLPCCYSPDPYPSSGVCPSVNAQ